MRTFPSRLTMLVAGILLACSLHPARAGAAPAGTWTVEGTATAVYRYEGRHRRIDYPFATSLVVHDDGTIDGRVTEPACGSGDPITFEGRWSGSGHAGITSALRAFVTHCYGERAHLRAVGGGIRLSADATRFSGTFRAQLRLPYGDADEAEVINVRLRGTVEGRRDE